MAIDYRTWGASWGAAWGDSWGVAPVAEPDVVTFPYAMTSYELFLRDQERRPRSDRERRSGLATARRNRIRVRTAGASAEGGGATVVAKQRRRVQNVAVEQTAGAAVVTPGTPVTPARVGGVLPAGCAVARPRTVRIAGGRAQREDLILLGLQEE